LPGAERGESEGGGPNLAALTRWSEKTQDGLRAAFVEPGRLVFLAGYAGRNWPAELSASYQNKPIQPPPWKKPRWPVQLLCNEGKDSDCGKPPPKYKFRRRLLSDCGVVHTLPSLIVLPPAEQRPSAGDELFGASVIPGLDCGARQRVDSPNMVLAKVVNFWPHRGAAKLPLPPPLREYSPNGLTNHFGVPSKPFAAQELTWLQAAVWDSINRILEHDRFLQPRPTYLSPSERDRQNLRGAVAASPVT